MTYGFGLDDDLHRRLRGAVAPEALAWVERETGSRVLTQRPLEGGTSAAIHRLALDGRDDLVLQRFILDWIAEEPWSVSNEVMVLGLLVDTDVPAPVVVAADADGALTGVPTVLMSALPGRVVWDPPHLDDWLQALVDTMITVHATAAPATLRDWSPYAPEGVPPVWTRHRWAWERAIAAYDGQRPSSDRVFVHRDFHPGNVLWDNGRVSGVVDWVAACAGPPEEDVAHCRVNLARHHVSRLRTDSSSCGSARPDAPTTTPTGTWSTLSPWEAARPTPTWTHSSQQRQRAGDEPCSSWRRFASLKLARW